MKEPYTKLLKDHIVLNLKYINYRLSLTSVVSTMENILSNSYWVQSTNKLGGIYPYYNIEALDYFTLNSSEVISYRVANHLARSNSFSD